MLEFICTNFTFDEPMATLRLPFQEGGAGQRFYEDVCNIELRRLDPREKAALIAERIEALIAELRPDLAGGTVQSMHLDALDTVWTFNYVHRSFARTKWKEQRPVIDLGQR